MITIDGKEGEGGGQIIRTALSLSAITKKPFKIENIRANRKNPGLQEQHLQAVNAVKQFCNADVLGNEKHSTNLIFRPGERYKRNLSIEINTAGSAALVLQTLFLASYNSKLNIKINGGGTWNTFAPSVLYLQKVFCPLLQKFGINIQIELLKNGFYPKGGAIVNAKIRPNIKLRQINLTNKIGLNYISVISQATKSLEQRKVAERQFIGCQNFLLSRGVKVDRNETQYINSMDSGTGILCFANYENTVIGVDNLGEQGKKAEIVGKEVAEKFIENFKSDNCVDQYMIDMLLPYLALLKGRIKYDELTNHAKTNVEIIKKFLDVEFKIKEGIIGVE